MLELIAKSVFKKKSFLKTDTNGAFLISYGKTFHNREFKQITTAGATVDRR